MIVSFADTGTEDVFNGNESKAARKCCPSSAWVVARRKLDQINAATRLETLRIPPGNRLEALRGTLAGFHSVRVNDQFRIVFRWTPAGAENVEITDYHGDSGHIMTRIPTHRPPTHPGEMLKEEFLVPLELTQRELAERLGVSYVRLSEIIHGKRGVTPDTALRLEQVLGADAQFWLNLQMAWDLYHARAAAEEAGVFRIPRLPVLAMAEG